MREVGALAKLCRRRWLSFDLKADYVNTTGPSKFFFVIGQRLASDVVVVFAKPRSPGSSDCGQKFSDEYDTLKRLLSYLLAV